MRDGDGRARGDPLGDATVGEWTWSSIVLANTDDAMQWPAVMEGPGEALVFPGSGIGLLEAEIDGQPVVAVVTGAPGFPPEQLADEALAVLEGLRRA